MQAQPPPETPLAAVSLDAGELKTDSCFPIEPLRHFGQVIFSRVESTTISKRCSHLRQQYSKIGMAFLARQKFQITN